MQGCGLAYGLALALSYPSRYEMGRDGRNIRGGLLDGWLFRSVLREHHQRINR